MDESRDDFIIAIRSAFLKKQNQQRFSLIFLIFFSILFLVLGKLNFSVINYVKISLKEVVYRSSYIISAPENYIKDSYKKIHSHFQLYNEYSVLKSQLKDLNTENSINEFIQNENQRLKKILDDYTIEDEKIFAKVLIDKNSPFSRSVAINKGSKDNIKLGMAVLEDRNLVGKIIEVNYLTSRVLLLTDLNSKIPVSIGSQGLQSILSGTGKETGIIQYLKEEYIIENGMKVFTSGSGGIFKSGIPIGVVEGLKDKTEKKVNFNSDFSQLKFVKIVLFKKESY